MAKAHAAAILIVRLFFIHHLNFALLPQHIGGQDADGQHHDDKDAHKAAQHGAVACKACGEGEHRHDDQHRQHALDAALDHLAAAGRAGKQTQRHGAEQCRQQVAGGCFDGGQLEHRADEGGTLYFKLWFHNLQWFAF